MRKKIIITGGLGYVDTELCKIYSGYSWNDNIIVEDNKLKHKKFFSGVKIPMYPKKKIKKNNPTVVVLAWNFLKILKKIIKI